jgi:membrane associated rhomboid family serine protease
MGESDRYIDYKNDRSRKAWLGMEGNALVTLLALNAIFTLLMLVLKVSFFFNQQNTNAFNESVLQWMILPDGIEKVVNRPWTLLTYMFTDSGNAILAILANMFWLWSFGYVMQKDAGNDKVIPLYLYSGFFGGLFFLLFNTIDGYWLMGSQIAVFGVATAATTYSPQYRILTHLRNGFPLWSVYIIFVVFNLITITAAPVSLGSALIGSGLAGVSFSLLLKKGTDAGRWMNVLYEKIIHVFSPARTPNKAELREKIFYKTGDRLPYEPSGNQNQKRIDQLLDKINENGYDSLTEKEKEILRKAGEE